MSPPQTRQFVLVFFANLHASVKDPVEPLAMMLLWCCRLYSHDCHAMRKHIYFKRHRMELDLRHPRPPAELPPGFYWLPWGTGLQDLHAQVKFHCFAAEMDARVFPSLSSLAGCRDLMAAIVTRPGFCPNATWLVASNTQKHHSSSNATTGVRYGFGSDVCVATVQGLLDTNRFGGIQNLGVIPEYRGLGVGWALLLKALEGFATMGAARAFLEVTAKNELAVRMYRRLGFKNYKTIYRDVEVEQQTDETPVRQAQPEKQLPVQLGLS